MTDRPILFSAPMVRALIAGTKTQTRRVLKEQCHTASPARISLTPGGRPTYEWRSTHGRHLGYVAGLKNVGDRLWVKEGWSDEHPLAVQEGRYSQPGTAGIPGPPPVSYRTIYRVDGEPLQVWRTALPQFPYFTLDGPADEIAARYPTVVSNYNRADGKGVFWGSARYMPKSASRLTLIVTDVRVQRLQEICEEDARAEGAYVAPRSGRVADDYATMAVAGHWFASARGWYADLWDRINGPGSWEANPWCAAYSFTVHQQNIDSMEPAR